MIFLWIILIPIIYSLLKIVIFFFVKKYGKISYDGFNAAGFSYNAKQDIFYSTKNAWQKNFGYSYIYDVFAPIAMMIIDTETIKFNYNKKNWLIAFWKGQYGITTGAEIGVYNTSSQYIGKKTLYMPINEDEMLDMCFTLYKNDEIISHVCSRHWWLTVFKLGMFSNPKDLTMDINITFPNAEMLEAFLTAFKKLKYKEKDYKIDKNTFIFKYKKPHTKKVWTRSFISDIIRQHYNKKNVELYNKYLSDAIDSNSNSEQKQITINDYIPDILQNKDPKFTEKKLKSHKDNIILLRNDIYSTLGEKQSEKENR